MSFSQVARQRRWIASVVGMLALGGLAACDDATAAQLEEHVPVFSRFAAGQRGPIRLQYVCNNLFRIRYTGTAKVVLK